MPLTLPSKTHRDGHCRQVVFPWLPHDPLAATVGENHPTMVASGTKMIALKVAPHFKSDHLCALNRNQLCGSDLRRDDLELSIEAALKAAKDGVAEREMLRAFCSCTAMNDASPVANCIGFGNHSAMIDVQPSDRRLRPGGVVRFEAGCRVRHYRSGSPASPYREPSPQ